MKTRLTLAALVGLFLFGAPLAGHGQCVGTFPNSLVPDGTPVVETIAANGVRTYGGRLNVGRSYSLQVTTPNFNASSTDHTLVLCSVDQGGVATTTDTTTADPSIIGFGDLRGGRRLSIVVSSSGVFRFDFTNTDTFGAHVFTVVLVETTLFNPAWSTFGTFETFYSCINTTNDSTLDATLTLFNTAGVQVGSPFNFTNVPAGGTVSTNTGALGVANNLNGSATLTHNGPPGAFLCEAAIANFAVTPNIIQPVKFEAARQTR